MLICSAFDKNETLITPIYYKMKKQFLFLTFVVILFSCKKASKEPLPEPKVLTQNISFKDIQNVGKILSDTEPVEIMVSRTINLRDPLSIEASGTNRMKLSCYTLKSIKNVDVFVKLTGYEERIKLLKIDSIASLTSFDLPVSITEKDEKLYTESGKLIEVKKQTDLSKAVFSVAVDDPFYKKLNGIKTAWQLNFRKQQQDIDNWYRMNPLHARECIAMFTNLAYLFSQDAAQKAFMDYEGLIENNGSVLTKERKEAVYKDILTRPKIETGLVRNVSGLGGGNLVAGAEYVLMRHYNKSSEEEILHELGHALGFSHSSNMTYPANNKAFFLAMRPIINGLLTGHEYPYWDYRLLNTYNTYIDKTGDYLREGKNPDGSRHNATRYDY